MPKILAQNKQIKLLKDLCTSELVWFFISL